MEHTPLKSDLSIVRDSKGNVLACCAGKEVAAEIVQAVNSHEALVEACKAAHMFIKNGIDFGFIRMPDDDCPDPAKDVPGIVAAALALAGVKP